MPISVACPTCGTKLKAPDDAVGKKVKCPKCASLIDVLAPEDEAAVRSAPTADRGEDIPEAGDDEVRPAPDAADEGGPLREEDKTWGLFAHLAGAFFGVLGALIVFLIKKDESAFLRHHTKESLNFQLTMIIGWLVAVLLSCCVGCVGQLALGAAMGDIGFLLGRALGALPYMALGAVNLILAVLQGLKAKKGEWSKYPFAIRLIK